VSRWKLYLLGAERMAAADGQAVSVPDICWPLLGSLISMPDRSASRATIADELWRDSADDASARHRLGTALWRVRTRLPALESALTSTGDRLTLQPGTGLWIDSIAFEMRVEAALGDQARLASPSERQKLRRALALYQGDFLSGRDHDAIAIERERLRSLFIDAAFALASAEARIGNWAEARDAARRLCIVEPLREDGQRLLIEAYAACGSRGLAIRQYRLLEQLLAEELGVAPMAETRQLAERVSGASLEPERETARIVKVGGPWSWRSDFRDTLISTRDQISRVIALLEDPPAA
jgi:DNA-binding SARP family transcriptional activator